MKFADLKIRSVCDEDNEQWKITLIWSCSAEYSICWNIFHAQRLRISIRALCRRYHFWMTMDELRTNRERKINITWHSLKKINCCYFGFRLLILVSQTLYFFGTSFSNFWYLNAETKFISIRNRGHSFSM